MVSKSNGKIEQLLNLNFRTGGWVNENTTFSFLLPFTDTNYCITGRPLAESLVSDRCMVFFVLTKYVNKITVTLSNCNLKTNICSSITIIGEQSNGKIEQKSSFASINGTKKINQQIPCHIEEISIRTASSVFPALYNSVDTGIGYYTKDDTDFSFRWDNVFTWTYKSIGY